MISWLSLSLTCVEHYIQVHQLVLVGQWNKISFANMCTCKVLKEYFLVSNAIFHNAKRRVVLWDVYSTLNLYWYLTESLVSKFNLLRKQAFHRLKYKFKIQKVLGKGLQKGHFKPFLNDPKKLLWAFPNFSPIWLGVTPWSMRSLAFLDSDCLSTAITY